MVLLNQPFPYKCFCLISISDCPRGGHTLMSYLPLFTTYLPTIQTALKQHTPAELCCGIPHPHCPFPGSPGLLQTILPDLAQL